MNKVETYNTLKDFCDELDLPENANLLKSFKIFGKKKVNEFHSFTMISYVHSEIENPDDLFPAQRSFEAPFGNIGIDNCTLDLSKTYSTIIAHKDGSNLFQADILKLDKPIKLPCETNYACILSHSCDISNDPIVSILPVFLEDELDQAKVSALKGTKVQPANVSNTINSWLENRNRKFLGLPAYDFNLNGSDSRALIYMKAIYTCPDDILPKKPVARLKYRALAYFQLRVAHAFLRDVKNSDETREI